MVKAFSHRPRAGVSVGAFSTGDRLIVAFAIVNDGTGRSGLFHPDRQDNFSRSTARAIITGRIQDAVQNGVDSESEMVMSFITDTTAQQFISSFRPEFKPTVDETDDVLEDTIQFGNGEDTIETRQRPRAINIVARLRALSERVVNASISV